MLMIHDVDDADDIDVKGDDDDDCDNKWWWRDDGALMARRWRDAGARRWQRWRCGDEDGDDPRTSKSP